jgi:threonine/homoserine/homoserine lactone efflux protein
MGDAIAGSIGFALGIAISPIPIAALILTLLSVHPRRNSVAFTAGWVCGIASVATIAVITPLFHAGDDPSDRRGWIRLTIGVILVLVAIHRWRARPGRDEQPAIPPLMRAIDGVGVFGVLGIGFALAAFNPKDMLLAAAGGAEIASADLSGGTTALTLVLFTAIAASTAIAPVGAYLIGGDRLDQHLHRSRDWLIRHNPVVMAVVLAAVGALFITEATQILTD